MVSFKEKFWGKQWKIDKKINSIKQKYNNESISFIIKKIQKYYDDNERHISTEEYLSRLSRLNSKFNLDENILFSTSTGLLFWFMIKGIESVSKAIEKSSNLIYLSAMFGIGIVPVFITLLFIYYVLLKPTDKKAFEKYLIKCEREIVEKKLENRINF